MFASIILPTRNRTRNVGLCLWSLHQSFAHCNLPDYEVIIVDNGSNVPPHPDSPNVQLIHDKPITKLLNKPHLQNRGIDASQGDIIVFLDADALVPPLWANSLLRLYDEPILTRLCYRVHIAPEVDALPLETAEDRPAFLNGLFARYDSFDRAHEGYGRPEYKIRKGQTPLTPIFGNSQFAMRRDVLGDLRYNEEYEGRGFEDLWFIRETWKRDPSAYLAEIVTDPSQALLHIQNTVGGLDWFVPGYNDLARRRYEGTWGGMKNLLPIGKPRRAA